VHTPDLFEGRTFETIEAGVEHAQEVGFGEIIERGTREAEKLPAELVYAGFSLGVVSPQKLAQTRPGAKGPLLYYSCVPASELGAWPKGVPVQVHGADADPYFVDEGDIDAARAPGRRHRRRCTLHLSRRPALPCRQHPPLLRRDGHRTPAGSKSDLPQESVGHRRRRHHVLTQRNINTH
jgi:hypothetical protein